MSICVCVCLCVCAYVCVHDNSKTNSSIHLKLEHIVVYEDSSDDFDIELCRSRSRSRHDFEFFLHLLQYKLSSHISQLWHLLVWNPLVPKQDIYYHEKRCIFQLVRCIFHLTSLFKFNFKIKFYCFSYFAVKTRIFSCRCGNITSRLHKPVTD